MVVASQQITVKVGPLKEPKGQRRHREEHREEPGRKRGGGGGAGEVGREPQKPVGHYSSSS